MADGAYKEIKASLNRIEDKLGLHGEKLSAIDQHLITINGSVCYNRGDIDKLFILHNDNENTLWKWKGVIVGVVAAISIIATVFGIFIFAL